MSENEQEVVPVKIAEISDAYKYIEGGGYAVHVVMTSPPPITFDYCFKFIGWWLLAAVCWAAILFVPFFIIMMILAALGVVR